MIEKMDHYGCLTFSIKSIFYDKMDLRLFYFCVKIWSQNYFEKSLKLYFILICNNTLTPGVHKKAIHTQITATFSCRFI